MKLRIIAGKKTKDTTVIKEAEKQRINRVFERGNSYESRRKQMDDWYKEYDRDYNDITS